MTNEEQIDWLCRLRGELEITPAPKEWKDNCKQALSEAIKALEQEPCEDAISRKAVMNALCDGCELFKNGEQTFHSKCEEYHFLATLPPVNPQPKTGHWITHHESMTLLTGETATGGVVCSECGYKTHNKAHVLIGCPYKYCPNCGAKMVEPQESEGGEE